MVTEKEIAERKTDLRKQMDELRSALTAQERKATSERICNRALQLLPCLVSQKGDGVPMTLFTYVPRKTEVDVTPVMEWCWQRGHKVLVPRSEREGRTLVLHEINRYEDLETGNWGIREPKRTMPIVERLSQIDLMLVPGLAFDLHGGRLGYGGGYYDRFAELLGMNMHTRADTSGDTHADISFDSRGSSGGTTGGSSGSSSTRTGTSSSTSTSSGTTSGTTGTRSGGDTTGGPHSRSRPIKLALAYDFQIVSDVPMESHDMRVDYLITENRSCPANGIAWSS